MTKDSAPASDFLVPVQHARPKQFDTRMLDRVEACAAQYRHWLRYANEYASYSAEIQAGCAHDIAYVNEQLEATRKRLQDEAQSLATELGRWKHE